MDLNSSFTQIGRIAEDNIQAIYDKILNGGKPAIRGLETGFTLIDEALGGLHNSDLILIGGRPGMGKTSFALNLVMGAAKKNPQTQICIFSLEMSKEKAVSRIITGETGISSEAFETVSFSIDEMCKAMSVAQNLKQMKIYIDDSPSINVVDMRLKLYRMKNLGLIIIDYLQLVEGVDEFNGKRLTEMSEKLQELKELARGFNVPIIVLSQLPRALEERDDKHPLLSDLDHLDSYADVVLFLYRSSYYDKDFPKNVCECIIAKNHNDVSGSIVPLGWDGECLRFYNIENYI